MPYGYFLQNRLSSTVELLKFFLYFPKKQNYSVTESHGEFSIFLSVRTQRLVPLRVNTLRDWLYHVFAALGIS